MRACEAPATRAPGDEVAFAEAQDLGPYLAGEVGPKDERDHDDDGLEARTPGGREGEGEENARKRERDVDEPHDHDIGPTPRVARDQPEQGPDGRAHEDPDGGNRKGVSGPVHDPAQDAPSQAIRAEHEVPASAPEGGRLQPIAKMARVRIVGREPVGEERRDEENDQQYGDREQRIAAKV